MNSAARLLRIYVKLLVQPAEYQMIQTWAVVFESDEKSPHHEDEVTAYLMGLRAEIALTRDKLTSIGVPTELTSPAFEHLRDVAAPGQLRSPWSSHRGNLQSPECRKVFEWAAWALREDAEPDMPAEEMKELQAELESLEAALQDAALSPYLRDFIQRQVDTIRVALRLYRVQGARPLQDALQKVAGAYAVEGARVAAEHAAAPEAAKGVFAKAGNVIKKTAEVCDNLTKIGKLGEQAVSLAGNLGPLLLKFLS